jgi:hypothetical protein
MSKREKVIQTVRVQNSLVFSVLDVGTLTLDVDTLADSIREEGMFHGFTQKVIDAAAMSRDVSTGASATARQKFDAMRGVVEALKTGHWTSGGMVYRVLATMFPAKNPSELREWYDGKSTEERNAIRMTRRYRDALETLRPGALDSGDSILNEIEAS